MRTRPCSLISRPPPGMPTRSIGTTASRSRSRAARAGAGAPAGAWENIKSKKGLSIALVPWPGAWGKSRAVRGGAHSGIAVLDVDNDRDLDLVLSADKSGADGGDQRPAGQFPQGGLKASPSSRTVSGTSSRTSIRMAGPTWWPLDSGQANAPSQHDRANRGGEDPDHVRVVSDERRAWPAAIAVDLDLDGLPDLLGLQRRTRSAGGTADGLGPESGSSDHRVPLRGTLETLGVEAWRRSIWWDPLPDLLHGLAE